MDLENFDNLDEGHVSVSHLPSYTAEQALDEVDEIWFRPATRRARWMDLLGDYAGSEPFVIDGESLLQIVLGDPLLAIGRAEEPSFQILHAFQILEQTLVKFKQRSAEIEIVFWSSTCHATVKTGDSLFSVTSRLFARTLLLKHLAKLDIAVHQFKDLDDPSWLRYESTRKPMFVMTNDGGVLDDQRNLSAESILAQRMFVFDLLSRGLPLALLKGAKYRDSKILSFVYERSRDHQGRKIFSKLLIQAINEAHERLDDELTAQSGSKIFHLILSPIPKNTRQNLDKEQPQNVNSVDLPVDYRDLIVGIAKTVTAEHASEFPIELLYIFIAHCILLRIISVQERARRYEKLSSELQSIIINKFLPAVFLISIKSVFSAATSLDVDGRVFCSLVRFFILHRSKPAVSLIGQPIYAAVQEVWSSAGLSPVDLAAFGARFPQPHITLGSQTSNIGLFHLLPFENDVFNAELPLVHTPVQDEDIEFSAHQKFGPGTLFSDTQHWHNQKTILPSHLGGSAPKPLDERHRRRILRQNQRFMATLQTQAATLTGASGGSLQQIVIPAVGSSNVHPKSRPVHIKAMKKEKTPKLSSADKLRQKIANEKASSHDDASDVWWRDQLNIMSKMTTKEKVTHIKSLYRNKRGEERAIGAEMRLYRLHLEIILWIDEPDHDSASIRDIYTVSIMRMIKEISDRRFITPTIAKSLTAVLVSLGFGGYSSSLLTISETADKPISFKFTKLISSKTKSPYHEFMHITEHPVVWQLRLFGEFMDRSMDSSPDHRVAFDPDAWQREVLDCIDADNSLLIVAPTSAGKTFISYYAMEKVLRSSDEGILVYVAPTKALVTQIAAEVYARFKSCWAIHTRDYRINDPQKCQILVTVPEMLAIMLLSPPLARVWTSRIKRIILDEIHSIGQQEGGAVWEQIILLAPCPIIGLSATIGLPEKFNEWLQSVQHAHGYTHKFIQYPHRYSHLRKFYYDLTRDPPSSFKDLHSHKPTGRARFLHPISLLAFGARSLPSDLALEAGDTLSLYGALAANQKTSAYDIAALEPAVFFASKSDMLRQKDVVEYEAKLKGVVSLLINSFDVHDASSPLYDVIHSLDDPELAAVKSSLNTMPSRPMFKQNLIHLLADLHSRSGLPAILFNFNRTDCEIMVQTILSSLEAAEELWRSNSPEWKRKIRDWENWKLRSKERERLAERAKKQKKDQDAELPSSADYSWESSFDPEDPVQEFSFAGTHTSYTKVELGADIRDMARWAAGQPWALEALKRGIAVHHSGMSKRYRSLVESLFRQGFIRVVIATGTLALGINAPTKTSVFCGDSPFLTALMYRQCAGRAGRRGYDLLGNVIFYGITLDRVQRLVLSKLPTLGGNFPLTSTLTMRLLNLLEGSDYAPVAVKAVKSIMSLPHISFISDEGRQQLLHHIRFSIEFLRRSRLVDRQGKPMNLFAIAAHLYYTEPSNFALVALLQQGVLHRICQQSNIISAQKDFILLMAHLFGRRYLSRIYASKKHLLELSKKYPSMIILPPLSKIARRVLIAHDKEILRVFVGYATEYASALEPDCTLPLSKLDYSGNLNSTSKFRDHLKDTAIPVIARSLFVANSGHDDEFRTVQDLTRTAREGLSLNEHAIPSLSELGEAGEDQNSENLEHCLNAYLYDFYIHGQVSALAAANGIRRGDVWYLLQDFTLVLMTIKAALEQLLTKASKEAQNVEMTTEEAGADDIDVDSGYASFDPAEAEQEAEEDGDTKGFPRPAGISDSDWRVYEVVCGATAEFDRKYKAMWA